MRHWVFNVLIGLDQMLNSILGGEPDETISSRAARGRASGNRWARATCSVLDWLDPSHCEDAVKSEKDRKHLPDDLR